MPIKHLDALLRQLAPVRRVGVALSGGGDSVALLYASVELSAKRKYAVAALHVQHGLRPEAEDDAAFCADLCRNLQVEFHRFDLDPRTFAGNVHDAARKARYHVMEQAARELNLDVVLTAHTLDDQAETIIQRLMRGTGPDGLAGIRERSGLFARPWLTVRRDELRRFLNERNLTWREDRSNADRRYLRTRIRLDVLPAMEKAGGAHIARSLGRLAALADEQRRWLDEIVADDYRRCLTENGLAVEVLAALPHQRRAAVLRRWLRERDLIPPARVIDQLERMALAPGPTGTCRLPDGLSVERSYKTLNWNGRSVVEEPWETFAAGREIDRTLADGHIHLRVGPVDSRNTPTGQIVVIDDLREAQWRRPWPGARLAPRGMKGTSKLQDLFTNAKIPRALRPYWPVLARGEEILLVAGLRAGRGLKESKNDDITWLIQLEWSW
ncbi:MAG TPA: tRNA lysidine(34) synthetase TilS [bacterium]|nr:tRNA lysidine(34) synthetase TilS [bacterium]